MLNRPIESKGEGPHSWCQPWCCGALYGGGGGGGHSGARWIPTAKRLQTINVIGAVTCKLCLFSFDFVKYVLVFIARKISEIAL